MKEEQTQELVWYLQIAQGPSSMVLWQGHLDAEAFFLTLEKRKIS